MFFCALSAAFRVFLANFKSYEQPQSPINIGTGELAN